MEKQFPHDPDGVFAELLVHVVVSAPRLQEQRLAPALAQRRELEHPLDPRARVVHGPALLQVVAELVQENDQFARVVLLEHGGGVVRAVRLQPRRYLQQPVLAHQVRGFQLLVARALLGQGHGGHQLREEPAHDHVVPELEGRRVDLRVVHDGAEEGVAPPVVVRHQRVAVVYVLAEDVEQGLPQLQECAAADQLDGPVAGVLDLAVPERGDEEVAHLGLLVAGKGRGLEIGEGARVADHRAFCNGLEEVHGYLLLYSRIITRGVQTRRVSKSVRFCENSYRTRR